MKHQIFYVTFFSWHSPGSGNGSWIQTLDIGMMRRVFYHHANPTDIFKDFVILKSNIITINRAKAGKFDKNTILQNYTITNEI
jgi:hypothetical protein